MIKIVNANPFAEAMFYLTGRANNEGVEKRLAKILKQYPEHKEILSETVKPALELERLLDAKLEVNDVLVAKYFKKFPDESSKTMAGFCLAFLLIYHFVATHIQYTADELCSLLRECSVDEQLFSCFVGLTDNAQMVYMTDDMHDVFIQRLNSLNLPHEDKWKILSAVFSYSKHINELLSLIMPTAKLIEEVLSNEDISIFEAFQKQYSKYTVQSIFEMYSKFETRVESSTFIRMAPLILGFNKSFIAIHVLSENDNNTLKHSAFFNKASSNVMLLGIAQHLISQPPQYDVPMLCEKMKALSDETRLDILFYLCSHKAYGQELCTEFEMGHSAIAYHISKLASAGFVTAELSGSKTYYTADKAGIQRMLDSFAEKIK